MKLITKIILSVVLLFVAFASEGILAVPAFAAFLFLWGLTPTK